MAFYNITYTNKKIKKLIDDEMGKKYRYFTRVKMGGIGFARMLLVDLSPGLAKAKLPSRDMQYANVELRPKGIIVHISKHIQTYAWTIPYHHLSVYQSDVISIHAAGEFLKFDKKQVFKQNKNIVSKLLQAKNGSLEESI